MAEETPRTNWDFEAAKAGYVFLADAQRQISALKGRWDALFDIQIMHTTYAGKQSWMVPSAETLGRTERIWTDKPLAEKTTELQDMIANLGRRVDAMKAETASQTQDYKPGVRY